MSKQQKNTGIAAPAAKKLALLKKSNPKAKLSLDRVIGSTAFHNTCFAINNTTGEVAYPAGCVVVLFNPKKIKQQFRFLVSKSNKSISSLVFSPNGKYLAVGETGHQPSIVVWDVATKQIIHEFKGHQFGVSCMAFSPNMKYIASVGFQHDQMIYVWDLKGTTFVASTKISCKIWGISFSEEGNFFVTFGNKHIRYWYLDSLGNIKKPEKGSKTSALEGRVPNLGNAGKDNVYLDGVCGKGNCKNNFYCVNNKGLLSCFSGVETPVLEKWVNLKTSGVYSIAVTDKYVACGCANGVVRLFDPETLEYINTLPKPHSLGKEYLAKESVTSLPPSSSQEIYPDSMCCKISPDNLRILTMYSDKSLFVWDIKNPKKVGRIRSFLAHSGCVWDLDVLPYRSPQSNISPSNNFPPGTFVTCSADNTIRFWNLDGQTDLQGKRNVYSREVLRTVWIGEDFTTMKAKDSSSSMHLFAIHLTRPVMTPDVPNSQTEGGVRCVKVSPDGMWLASGDRLGNLRIHDLRDLNCLHYKEAHDAEILSLDFSQPDSSPQNLLCSASRDRLIHVFDIRNNFNLAETLDDHSSSITAVKFAMDGTKLLSCSADKSIVFREVGAAPFHITRYHQAIAQYGTVFDMDVDATNKFIITGGQDKKLNIYSVLTGKASRSYKVESEAGEVIKVKMDPAGIYTASSSSDKCIRLYDFYSGECLAKVSGHSELVTGLAFTPDCTRLISASGDGCIFVWKLSSDLTKNMHARLCELHPTQYQQLPQPVAQEDNNNTTEFSSILASEDDKSRAQWNSSNLIDASKLQAYGTDSSSMTDSTLLTSLDDIQLRLSETSLPPWARKQTQAASKPSKKEQQPKVKGKWAQRVGSERSLFAEHSEKPVSKWDMTPERIAVEVASILPYSLDKENSKLQDPSMIALNKLVDSKQDSSLVPSSNIPLKESTNKYPKAKDASLSPQLFSSASGLPHNMPGLLKPQHRTLEDEDDVIYEEPEEVEDAENEETDNSNDEGPDTEQNQEETIYDNNETTTAESPEVVVESRTPSEAKPDEEEEIELIEDASKVAQDEFTTMDQADFLKSNFESLASNQKERINPMRLSISTKFLKDHPNATIPQLPPTTDASLVNDAKILLAQKQRQRDLLLEVEKTRQRLAQLGISVPVKSTVSSSLEFAATVPLVESPLAATEPSVPEPVTQSQPTLANLILDSSMPITPTSAAPPAPLAVPRTPSPQPSIQPAESVSPVVSPVMSPKSVSDSTENMPAIPVSVPEPEEAPTVVSIPTTQTSDTPTSTGLAESTSLGQSQGLESNTSELKSTSESKESEMEDTASKESDVEDETELLSSILQAPSSPVAPTKKQATPTLPRPMDSYRMTLSSFTTQLDVFLTLFDELKNQQDMLPDQRDLLESYQSTLSTAQTRINDSMATTATKAVSVNTSPYNVSLSASTMSAFQPTASLLATNSVDLTRTLETYSNMLLEMVKSKLHQ